MAERGLSVWVIDDEGVVISGLLQLPTRPDNFQGLQFYLESFIRAIRIGMYNSDTMLELYVYDEDSGRLKLLQNDDQYSCVPDATTIFLHHRTTPPGIWNFIRYVLYTYTTTLCNFIIRMTAIGVIYS